MRRSEKEITDKELISDIINCAKTARLGINREGCPYIVPMNFGYSDGVFYFHCASEGLKLDLLKADPRVCIEIDEERGLQISEPENPCSWGFSYRSVIAEGTAEFVIDTEEKRDALNQIISRFADQKLPAAAAERINAVTVFKVKAEKITAKASN